MLPVEIKMESQSVKKRPLPHTGEERKAKRKKNSEEDGGFTVEVEEAVMMGEIPKLFHMQMQEVLKEVRMKKKRAEKLAEVIEKLKDVLLNLSSGKERKLHLRAWMKEVKLPVLEDRATKGCFQFRAPTRVYLGGSTSLNTCVQPSKAADLFLEMPKECFQAKDWLNQRYMRKRAMYLSAVAVRLRKTSLAEDFKFTYHQGNQYKPILVLSVSVEGKGKTLTLHLHAIPEEGAFKPSRFHITKNNARPRWFSGQQEENGDGNENGSTLPSTPVYNTSILQDICHEANAKFLSERVKGVPEVQDAIAMIKLWSHQRELDVGYGSFSGFLVSMFVCHLLNEGLVLPSMSSHQILRVTLLQLSKSRWLEIPVVLCPELGKGGRPSLDQFLEEFDVVFVDVTGYVNLALGMTKGCYQRVCHEAELMLSCLTGDSNEQFDHLFMTPCPFHLKFDLVFTVSLTDDLLQRVVKKLQLSKQVLDLGGAAVSAMIPQLLDLLEQGLRDRVLLVQPKPTESPVWSVTEKPPPRVSDFSFGLLLHESNCLRLLDRGPAANVAEALEFRQFWGEKSELRRFKDGGISEAVVWTTSLGLSQKRNVCSQIVTHVLNRHAAITSEQIHSEGQQLLRVLHIPRQVASVNKSRVKYGTGEESIYAIRQVLEELSKTLRGLPGLALRISAVSGIHPAFKFTEVFPPHPVRSKMTSEKLLKGDKPLLLYTPAMTVICYLEGSGHWPEDIERIRDLKTLYLIDLAQKLRQVGSKVAVHPAYLDVLQSGYVFHLKLGVKREVAVLRMVHTPDGMLKMEDTPGALAVDAEINTLPKMTTLLQGVQQDHPSFCVTVRLIKRWMSAQMLLGHVPELVLERMVMELFINPLPFTAPGSPLVGLLRFLKLASSKEFKVDKFCDKVAKSPPPVILNWWRNVAGQAQSVLLSQPEGTWKVIFRPPIDVYDIVVHLSPHLLTRRHQGVGVEKVSTSQYPQCDHKTTETKLPIVEFNPAEMLLKDLQNKYGDFALFFHDIYGGDVIAVLLKPETKEPKKFEVNHLFCHKPTVVNGEPALLFDLDAMVDDLRGEQLVTEVTVKHGVSDS